MRKRRALFRLGFTLFGLFVLLNCAGPQVLQEKEVIKPVDSYSDPVTRDVAQMLYPGFLEINEEFRRQFPEGNVLLTQYGLQVKDLHPEAEMPAGYYVSVETSLGSPPDRKESFLTQAEIISEQYLHNVLVALSRDWNTVFSPSISGVQIIFFWEKSGRSEGNQLMFLLKNEDIQNYLNARLTLQELVDQNWVEGREKDRSLGRIELNGLGVDQL